mmetsp:Transcript_12945/g.16957  ORF Transcript_12945/g.16957 Transcript_12945/m.16957 type:complete len:94 (+) Transcript_12945:51-332(+)
MKMFMQCLATSSVPCSKYVRYGKQFCRTLKRANCKPLRPQRLRCRQSGLTSIYASVIIAQNYDAGPFATVQLRWSIIFCDVPRDKIVDMELRI